MSSGNLFDTELDWREEKGEIKIDTPSLFEEMEKEINEFLLDQQVEGDSTDGTSNFLDNVTNRIQEEFDEIIEEDNDKKSFIKSLMHIFALLFNTKVDSVDKIKRTLKIAINTTLKLWSGQN